MNLFERLKEKKECISVIGLGYVGLPLAVELSKKFEVIGYDTNEKKLEKYKNGIDVTNEVGDDEIKKTKLVFTNKEHEIKKALFHIVAVPTPINSDKTPNLTPIVKASEVVGRNLKKGSIVVFESTVYPGTTEEICVPILEKESGLMFGKDFEVGYSPERINPGDKKNTLTNIIKVVSGSNKNSLEIISEVYSSIIIAGVHQAESIKVAEAAKVIENSQRDINIAFMNELSMVFNKMNINTKAVLEAAGTKWNFMNFSPGLVGGHCIGVDPYYFTYKAEQLGYHSQIILAGRKINDGMGKYVAQNVIKQLIKADSPVKGARVGILGVTFKENCSDVRNTKVIDIINELEEFGVKTIVYDPLAVPSEVFEEYGISIVEEEELKNLNAVVATVAHQSFIEKVDFGYLEKLYDPSSVKIFIDVKSVFDKGKMEKENYFYWSL